MIALLLFTLQNLEPGIPPESSPGWLFLADKYDADRDGRIVPAEYPRSAASFARLDRDGDGVLAPPDWLEAMAAQWRDEYMQAPQLQGLLMQCFQQDAAPELGRDEFLQQLAATDRDGDRRLSAAEAPGPEAWAELSAHLDPQQDGFIAHAELAAAFDRLDVNRDGELVPPGQRPLLLPLQPDDKPLALIFGSFT